MPTAKTQTKSRLLITRLRMILVEGILLLAFVLLTSNVLRP